MKRKPQSDRELLETVLLTLIDSQRQLKQMHELLEQNVEYSLRGKQFALAGKQQSNRATTRVSKRLDDVLDNILDQQFDLIHQLVLVKMFGIDKAIENTLREDFGVRNVSKSQLGGLLALLLGRKPDKLRQLISRPDFCWVDRANEPKGENTLTARNFYRANTRSPQNSEDENSVAVNTELKVSAALKAAGLATGLAEAIEWRGKTPQ